MAGLALWAPGQTLDDVGEALWSDVLASWQDATLHDRFLRHCVGAGRLAAAGARYRAYRESHPDDEQASRMQKKIVALAAQFLMPSPGGGQRRQAPGLAGLVRSRWFILIVVAGACGGAVAGFVWGGLP